ncbi:MAG: TonB family protein [Oligoflexia bacterium]|nr:TonB family protein [Oligoflexia bacterium]
MIFSNQNIDELSEGEVFKKMVGLSIAIHVSLFLFFALKATFFPSSPIDLEAAVRVDIVDLPDKLTELPPEMNTKDTSKPMPPPKAKEEVVNLNKKKSALDKIREFEKEEKKKKSIKQIQEEVNRQEEAERMAQAKKYLVKGNIINKGTALKGLTKSEFNEYVGRLHGHIQGFWNLPEWLLEKDLKASVVAYVDAQGKVVKKQLLKSSGDPSFDEYAMQAVENASPLPAPPEKFTDIVRYDGIVFRFPN